MPVDVKLDTSQLDRIVRDTPLKTNQIINRLAFQIEGRAKALAPVDTGALKNSIYTVTTAGEGGTGAMGVSYSKAKGRGKQVQFSPLPTPKGPYGAVVGPSVSYAIYVELGTSRMGARPFLYPALQTVSYLFNAGQTWRELIE